MTSINLSPPALASDETALAAMPPTPEFGNVIDSVEDAATRVTRIICSEAELLVDDLLGAVREKPIAAIAMVGAIASLLGRLTR